MLSIYSIRNRTRFLQLSIISISALLIYSSSAFGQTQNETGRSTGQDKNNDAWLNIAANIIIPATIGGVGSILTWTIHQREKREKKVQVELAALEVKNKLVQEINDCVMAIIVRIMRVEEFLSLSDKLPHDLEDHKDELKKEYENFLVKSHVIQSQIQAYFDDGEEEGTVSSDWTSLIDFVKFAKMLSESHERKYFINSDFKCQPLLVRPAKIEALLERTKKRYWNHSGKKLIEGLAGKKIEAWYALKHAIVYEKNEIIKRIFDECIVLPSQKERIG